MRTTLCAFGLTLILVASGLAFQAGASDPTVGAVARPDSISPQARNATDLGPAPPGTTLRIAVGLDLHDKDELDLSIARASDPSSPQFQGFLSQDEFNARYGPTPAQEARVVAWLSDAGFHIDQRFPNRLLVVATGDQAAIGRAFHTTVHRVLYRGAERLVALDPPFFPADVSAFSTGVTGLDDLVPARPLVTPHASLGSSCCSFAP